MVSKKKSKSKKAPARKKRSKPALRSAFVKEFDKQLLCDSAGKFIWPPAGTADSVVFQNISDTVVVLGNARTGLRPIVNPGSAFRDRVAAFVVAQDWPLTSPIPATFKNRKAQVRLAEICDIVHRMIVAVNAAGGGGSGGELPPHHL